MPSTQGVRHTSTEEPENPEPLPESRAFNQHRMSPGEGNISHPNLDMAAQPLSTSFPPQPSSVQSICQSVGGLDEVQDSHSTLTDVRPYQVSEEDGHVQTLYRMGQAKTPTNLSAPVKDWGSGQHRVFEYFDRLSSVSVLSEALGHRQPQRLVQIDLLDQNLASTDNEVAEIRAADVEYLNSHRVLELPQKDSWYVSF